MIKGYDWASYQGKKPATSGGVFAFIKVTQGTGYVNPDWQSQLDTADKAGYTIGFYHYLEHGNIAAQIDFFVKTANPGPMDMLACDWESSATNAEKNAFIQGVKAKIHNPMLLYCNLDYWLHKDTNSYCGDGLWIADPSASAGKPRVQHAWMFHQYGTKSGVDLNVSQFESQTALNRWINSFIPPVKIGAPALSTDQSIAKAVLYYDDVPASRVMPNSDAKTNKTWTVRYALQAAVEAARSALLQSQANGKKLDAILTKLGEK